MTEFQYESEMINGHGWATACEIATVSTILGYNINVHMSFTLQNGAEQYNMYTFSTNEGELSCTTIDLLLNNEQFQVMTLIVVKVKSENHPPKTHMATRANIIQKIILVHQIRTRV